MISPSPSKESTLLPGEVWQKKESAYCSQVKPWIDAFRKRRERSESNPVHDFLFRYYHCKRKLIAEWHPPFGVTLQGEKADKFLDRPHFSMNTHGVFLDSGSINEMILNRFDWIQRLLESALIRINQHHCFGLHEWAMLYRSKDTRHEATPLRLNARDIERVVESNTIRCTHYDAFRFFTEEAKPLNTCQPKPEERRFNEQFGCVHFNMDLFKWCYKLHPWISSELMLDCFSLAIEARELDMRASPYDLRHLGYTPIPIETSEGRALYQKHQTIIGNKGRALASRLLEEIFRIKEELVYKPCA